MKKTHWLLIYNAHNKNKQNFNPIYTKISPTFDVLKQGNIYKPTAPF